MSKKNDDDPILHWVRTMEVIHWRTGKPMRRKDGKPFIFPIRKKRKK